MNPASRDLASVFETKEEFERVLDLAESNAASDFEIGFVESMRTRYERVGMRMFLSPRQEEVLDDIAYKK